MERRYLIATLALAATFAACSHEMRGGHFAVLASQRLAALRHCARASSSRLWVKCGRAWSRAMPKRPRCWPR